MTYVDGYVLPVKKKELKTYMQMAKWGAKTWKKCGALEYIEAVGDDMTSVKKWKGMPFPKMVKTKPNEVVIFSFIVFKSKKHRDSVNKKVHKEMEKQGDKWKDVAMPFNISTMAYGGFKSIVHEK